MYSSCKEIHIAVEQAIQQINANRQESIRPQYIDIALNSAIKRLIKDKIKAYEETGKFYDDLESLKRTVVNHALINSENRFETYLPSDYLYGVSFSAGVIFDKFHRYRNKVESLIYTTELNLSSLFDALPNALSFSLGINGIDYTFTYPITIYQREGAFSFINYLVTSLRGIGFNVYFEPYGKLRPNLLVFVSYEPLQIQVEPTIPLLQNSVSKQRYNGKYEVISEDIIEEHIKESKWSGLDLVSDVARRDMLQTYHNAKNRHIHPICTIENGKLLVDSNDDFVLKDISVTYIADPVPFDVFVDTYPKVSFINEIIDVAVQILLGNLKDNAYQIAVNEVNSNK